MSTTATIEFPFEPPCPGQLDGLLALAVDREDGDRAAAARARGHTVGCSRCRRSLHWIGTQRRALHQVNWRSATTAMSSSVPVAVKKFETWLDRSLGTYSASMLEHAAWKLAFTAAHADSKFSAVVVPAQFFLTNPTLASLEEGLLSAISDLEASRPDSAAGRRDGTVQLRDLVTRLKRALPSLRLDDNNRLAMELLDVVIGTLRLRPGRACLLRATLEWFHGDRARVRGLLEPIGMSGVDLHTRAQALSNWSVLEMDCGNVGLALRLRSIAEMVDGAEPLGLKNKLYVDAMFGNQESVEHDIRKLCSTSFGTRLLTSVPVSGLLKIASLLGDILELPLRIRQTRATHLIKCLTWAARAHDENDHGQPGARR